MHTIRRNQSNPNEWLVVFAFRLDDDRIIMRHPDQYQAMEWCSYLNGGLHPQRYIDVQNHY